MKRIIKDRNGKFEISINKQGRIESALLVLENKKKEYIGSVRFNNAFARQFKKLSWKQKKEFFNL